MPRRKVIKGDCMVQIPEIKTFNLTGVKTMKTKLLTVFAVVTMVLAANSTTQAVNVTSDNQVLDGVSLAAGEDIDILSGGDPWNVTFRNMTFDASRFMQDGTSYGNAGLGTLRFENCTFTNPNTWDSLYLTVKRGEVINSNFSNMSNTTVVFQGVESDPVDIVLDNNTWTGPGSWGAFEVSGSVNSLSVTDNTFSGLGAPTYFGHAIHTWSRNPYTLEMAGNDFTDGGAVWFLSNIGKEAAANNGTATDIPMYVPNATFSGNTSNSGGAIIDVAGWHYTSPTYTDLRYTQGDTSAANAARESGLTDYRYGAANTAIWDITGQSDFENIFLLRDRTIDGASPRVEGDIVFVPEPSTGLLSLLCLGLLALATGRWNR